MSSPTQKRRNNHGLRSYAWGIVILCLFAALLLTAIGVAMLGIGFLIVTMPMTSVAVIGCILIALIGLLVNKLRK